MFFTLKYGEDQELIVNSNCKILNLLNYIKRIANIDENFEIEVCDLNGEVKNLQENKQIYANGLLKEKEKYVLLKIEKKGTDGRPVYSVLLKNDEIITEDFLSKLNSIKKTTKSIIQTKVVKTKQLNHQLQTKTKQRQNEKHLSNGNVLSINDQDASPR